MNLHELPLMILPGLMCNSRMFAGQLTAFPQAQVIDGFYGGANRIEDMAEYAIARMPGQVVLLGHSMGARVALEVMRQAPDGVAALILANTGVHPVRAGEAEKRYVLRDLGLTQGMQALVSAWLPPMLAPANRADTELAAVLEGMCLEAGQETYEAQIAALLNRPDPSDTLRGIACPTLVITGSDDAWAPPAQHAEIAGAISGAILRTVQDAGHMLPAEDPASFNAAITELLDDPHAA